ncbi:hypothetical protein [Ralstonia pseudosolanacearum]|uniref:hypothetical protein n=1 Tax=Ralstonia pseudosolanacearum TaxID=1310165 RepID=UPI0015A3723E|nr:hypothetical protein [Ralstonia pseudosolanacearum]MCL1618266.1 hypothetical protein [Ralstonia pseudosolanacearum CaRs-Mep]
MMVTCPHCQSSQVVTRNHARKVGGTIGAIAGAASGFSAAFKGARVGGSLGGRLGLIAGPPGAALGTVAGAILGGLLGGTAGCSAGTALGELVDAKVLANYRCLQCRHTFGESSAEAYVRRPPSFGESGVGAYGTHAFDPDEDDDTISLARG